MNQEEIVKSRLLVIAATIVAVVAAVAIAADDPFVGTWKLNIEKSKAISGSLPKAETMKIEPDGNGLKIIIDTVNSRGKANHSEDPLDLDGKDHPVTGHSNYDALTYKRIDPQTIIGNRKRDGKEVGSEHSVISQDGKTLTVTQKGKSSTGQDIARTLVYEKQ